MRAAWVFFVPHPDLEHDAMRKLFPALTIDGTDAMTYDKHALEVDASCNEVKLTLTHSGKLPANVMGTTGCCPLRPTWPASRPMA